MTLYPIPKSATTSLREVAIGVAGIDRSLELYRHGLGFEVIRRGLVSAVEACALWGQDEAFETVTVGRPALEGAPTLRLLECHGAPARAAADTRSPGTLGVGVTTDAIDRVHARLAAAGLRFQSPPVELTPEPVAGESVGPRRFEAFGQAPDGEFIVLIERRDAPEPYGTIAAEPFRTSEPLHCSHVVADRAAAGRFMEQALDHQVLFEEELSGPELDRLMGLPSGSRLGFQMLAHPDYPTGRIIFIEYPEHDDAPAFIEPPARGLHALRYDCRDLDRSLVRVSDAGGELLREPANLDSGALGRGRVATIRSPIGVLLELWQETSNDDA